MVKAGPKWPKFRTRDELLKVVVPMRSAQTFTAMEMAIRLKVYPERVEYHLARFAEEGIVEKVGGSVWRRTRRGRYGT